MKSACHAVSVNTVTSRRWRGIGAGGRASAHGAAGARRASIASSSSRSNCFGAHRRVGLPPDAVVGQRVVDDELVLRRAPGVAAGRHRERAGGGERPLAGRDCLVDQRLRGEIPGDTSRRLQRRGARSCWWSCCVIGDPVTLRGHGPGDRVRMAARSDPDHPAIGRKTEVETVPRAARKPRRHWPAPYFARNCGSQDGPFRCPARRTISLRCRTN